MLKSADLLQTVALKAVKCYAYHGLYPQENIIGQYYLVDVEVRFVPDADSLDLAKSVNYEVLNQIILQQMDTAQKLLETVVKNMIEQILSQFPALNFIEVGIHKLQPPMKGQVGESFVSLKYQV